LPRALCRRRAPYPESPCRQRDLSLRPGRLLIGRNPPQKPIVRARFTLGNETLWQAPPIWWAGGMRLPTSSDATSERIWAARGNTPGMEHAPDEALQRSRADFDGIYESEFGYVVKTLRRFGIPERDLADVAQEAFLRVYQALPSYDRARPIRPWLFGFALRTASNHSRFWRRRNLARAVVEVEVRDNGPTPEQTASSVEDRALLIRALQSLSLARRAVIVLHAIDGLPIPEVAGILRIPLNTAYSRLRRGLADLAKALVHQEGQGGQHGS